MRVTTLKRRSEFLRLRGGARWSTAALTIETKPRTDTPASPDLAAGPRFGFTVTKKLGSAVVRNRIRRRLKEALRVLHDDAALPGHDYVLIAKSEAATCGFDRLKQDLTAGLNRVNTSTQSRAGRQLRSGKTIAGDQSSGHGNRTQTRSRGAPGARGTT